VVWHYSDSVIRPRENLRRRDMQLKRLQAAIRRSAVARGLLAPSSLEDANGSAIIPRREILHSVSRRRSPLAPDEVSAHCVDGLGVSVLPSGR